MEFTSQAGTPLVSQLPHPSATSEFRFGRRFRSCSAHPADVSQDFPMPTQFVASHLPIVSMPDYCCPSCNLTSSSFGIESDFEMFDQATPYIFHTYGASDYYGYAAVVYSREDWR